jgi:DNA-binding MarR family transcriptional regulator
MTRLLDRIEKRKLISGARQTHDRSVVLTRITREGLDLLKTLDQTVRDLHRRQFRHMSAARLTMLVRLLEEVHPHKLG